MRKEERGFPEHVNPSPTLFRASAELPTTHLGTALREGSGGLQRVLETSEGLTGDLAKER